MSDLFFEMELKVAVTARGGVPVCPSGASAAHGALHQFPGR